MQITLHLGAHATDDDRLMRSLMGNADLLAREGTYVPGPSRFRTAMRDVVTRLKGAPASQEVEEVLLETILDTGDARHIVLSNDAFLCGASMIMAGGGYYARADRSAWLRKLFPSHQVRFALGLRNPATHVAALMARQKDRSLQDFMQGVKPEALAWSAPVAAILAANPGTPLLVWCNEDTPLLWPELMRRVADYRGAGPLQGGLDMAATLLPDGRLKALEGLLQAAPPPDAMAWRRAVAGFLRQHARPEELQQEIDLPDWGAWMVERMSAAYDADCAQLRGFPGVTFLD